jgi:hypothetical protein
MTTFLAILYVTDRLERFVKEVERDDSALNYMEFGLGGKLVILLGIILLILPPFVFGFFLLFFFMSYKYIQAKEKRDQHIQSLQQQNYQSFASPNTTSNLPITYTEITNTIEDIQEKLSKVSPEQEQLLEKELKNLLAKNRNISTQYK